MKKTIFLLTFLMFSVLLLSGCASQNTNQPMVGNDKDAHGCIPSAGYSWCEAKQKCLRPWEESCETTPLSEQPNQEKYNEYFTGAYLAKLPAGSAFNPFGIIKTTIFTANEQFCTSFDMKKQIPANVLSTSVYDVNAKQDIKPRSKFPQALGPGNSTGCETLSQTVGKYEYKVYINDDLVIVLPFEVK